jgi:hypothetical protein
MARAFGTTPSGKKARVIEFTQLDCDRVSIWIHPPGSDDESGWLAIVKLEELRKVLAAAGIIQPPTRTDP